MKFLAVLVPNLHLELCLLGNFVIFFVNVTIFFPVSPKNHENFDKNELIDKESKQKKDNTMTTYACVIIFMSIQTTTQCGNLRIFLPFRFYVKSILAHLESLNSHF